jgi:hypothetical protein
MNKQAVGNRIRLRPRKHKGDAAGFYPAEHGSVPWRGT